jgi:DNA-binding beta-propeller fold protein YncE
MKRFKKLAILSKLYFIVFTAFFASTNTIAQTTDVLTGVKVFELELDGNDLYFRNEFNSLSKIDLTETTPTITEVVNGLNNTYGIVYTNNTIYISESIDSTISKIDLTTPTPTVTELVSGLDYALDLAIQDNYLYFTHYNNGNGKISKINITETSPTVTDVLSGLDSPYQIQIKDNDLYFIHNNVSGTNTLSKIDLTETTPTITDILTGGFFLGSLLDGNDMYISNYDIGANSKITKIDITETSPTPEDIVTGLYDPWGLAIHDGNLYIAEISINKISKFDLPSLSTEENMQNPKLKLIPNPSHNFIQLQGLQETLNYGIYTITGQLITNGVIGYNEKIAIHHLSNGLYFLKLGNDTTLKFVKESK